VSSAASRRAARCGGGSRARGTPPPLPAPAAGNWLAGPCWALQAAQAVFFYFFVNYL